MQRNIHPLSSAWGLFHHKENGTRNDKRIDCVSGNPYNDRNYEMDSVICTSARNGLLTEEVLCILESSEQDMSDL
jgi:hypothetical protein